MMVLLKIFEVFFISVLYFLLILLFLGLFFCKKNVYFKHEASLLVIQHIPPLCFSSLK